ncbi:MAG: mannose-1-phosphate guanylyltransferase [Candidatus Woesebacteria bacterium]|jgi:mannose-1-phosphate guanylyltransferase/mannose-6-phosphate isomerase
MITVIIAGGSGTRLWPLSTNEYPKHLLNLVGDDSLLQGTYRRAKRISEHVYIATGKDHLQHVKNQLPELSNEHFIVEPARRDTAGCILLALNHVQSRHDNSEPIAFLHADHFIRDARGFVKSFRIAQHASKEHNAITLIGVEPSYPATGFGYIQKDEALDEKENVFTVKGFKEKPERRVAQQYIRSGNYLWNAGYFVGSINTFVDTMQKYAPDMLERYRQLQATKTAHARDEVFLNFEKIAIDYALMEKSENLLVVPATFDWMDLGSFNDVHGVSETDDNGNYEQGFVEIENVENSYIRNDVDDKPLAVIGLNNVVVINTDNGILVARKDQSQKVKDIVNKIKERSDK